MSASPPPYGLRVRSLSIHAAYRCADEGVCCSSGWEIPVEANAEDALRRAMSDGRLLPKEALRPAIGLPHGARVVLALDARTGRCVFQQAGPPSRCAVHERLGEEALPSSCRQFPRVVTLTPLGISVSLSHYCPTAAGLLFAAPGPLRIVEAPPAFPASWPFDGLDAREAMPPFLRPGVLASWAALESWEEHAVAILADPALAPEEAVGRLVADAERARAWTPGRGAFDTFFAEALRASGGDPGVRPLTLDPLGAWDLVASTVPPGAPRPSRPPGEWTRTARTCGAAGDECVRRWLAARAFASWLPLQGRGLRTSALGLAVSLAVLRAEQSRERPSAVPDGAATRGPGEPPALREAVRRADLLLVHLADPQALADRLSASERPGAGVLASFVPA